MLRKILFFSVGLAAMSYSMNSELQPLVKKEKSICIYAPSLRKKITLAINENTTILDIKQQFEAKERILTAQQTLLPIFSSWQTLWLSDELGPKLENQQNIKEIINKYSDSFLLTIKKQ